MMSAAAVGHGIMILFTRDWPATPAAEKGIDVVLAVEGTGVVIDDSMAALGPLMCHLL